MKPAALTIHQGLLAIKHLMVLGGLTRQKPNMEEIYPEYLSICQLVAHYKMLGITIRDRSINTRVFCQ
jgi:hypothetical protein